MSFRLQMLQVARLAPRTLQDSTDLVRQFLVSQQNSDGGFNDRSGMSDLYYTVFALEGLLALSPEIISAGAPPRIPQAHPLYHRTQRYLAQFGSGAALDFIHHCCLARAWASIAAPTEIPTEISVALLAKLNQHRTEDGGYHPLANQKNGTAYGCFLALGACQDLSVPLPDSHRLLQCLDSLRTPDGAWANDPAMKIGSTNATAAAVTILRSLSAPVALDAGQWLLERAHPQGGFTAAPQSPIPDLLSTATALHALASLEIDVASLKETCLDFIDTLWTNQGGFHGHWSDDHIDAEYTYYGLLALGHLSV